MALAVAVFVAFAFFPSAHRWFYRDEKEATQPEHARESGSNTSLLMRLDEEIRKREQAERERDTARQIKDHELGNMRSVLQAIEQQRDEALRDRLKWAGVTNLVVSLVRVDDLIPILEAACEKMDARMPSRGASTAGLTDVVLEFMRAREANDEEFGALRPKIIRVKTEVQAQHNLMGANLTDEKLTSSIETSQQIKKMIDGLKMIAVKLRDMIAIESAKAVDFKNQP
ncbi:MAG: hypothetical protein WBG27_14870 [Candidatus Aquilonibacter sp.]